MYNVVLVNKGKVEFNYAFIKKHKAQEFFKLSLMEHDSNAPITKSISDGVFISFKNVLKDDKTVTPGQIKKFNLDECWVLSISKMEKGSKL